MKRFILIAFFLFLVANPVHAAGPYYVDGEDIEGSGCSDSDDGLSLADAWCTIQKAADTLAAGETVYVRGGEYNECVDLSISGTSGNQITYIKYADETPIIDGTETTCTNWHGHIYANGIDYITIDGFEFADADKYAIRAYTSDNWIVQNCNFHDQNAGTAYSMCLFDRATDFLFKDNVVYSADRNGIDFQRGDRVTITGNTFHTNETHYGCQIYGDTLATEAEPFFYDNVVENNIVYGNAAGMYFRNNIRLILRGNLIYHNDGVDGYSGIHLGEGQYTSGSFTSNSRFYNNTIVGQVVSVYNESHNQLIWLNNIFNNPSVQIMNIKSDANANHTYDYNNYYGKTFSAMGANGFYDDPDFMSASPTYDFRLQSTSPCIDTGRYLTLADGGGTGTTMTVDDAYFFSDGFGYTDADYIFVDNPVAVDFIVQITDVTDATTLELASSQTWEDNAQIHLSYSSTIGFFGSAKDVGANEYVLQVVNVSPTDGGTYISITASATWDYVATVDDVDVYLDKGTCAAEAKTTLVSDDDADKTYDMSTLDEKSIYCLVLVANDGALQGTNQEFQFTTTGGPPAPTTGLSTISYHSLGMTGSYAAQGSTVGE